MDLAFRDRAVQVGETLVVADLHLGRDATSKVELPLGEREDIVGRLEGLLERFEPSEVVVAGDVLHAFGSMPAGVPEAFEAVVDAVETAGARLVVTPGNHDGRLAGVWSGPTPSEYVLDADESGGGSGTVVCHGHEPTGTDADRYVVGHDHPAITIEGRRRPCYLYGEGVYRGGDLLVVPAFNRLTAGAVVNGMHAGDFLSPLVTDVDALRPVVRDEEADETLVFPPLGEFRRML